MLAERFLSFLKCQKWVIFQFLFQNPVDYQSGEACDKVSCNSIFYGKIYWSCFEFCFHDSKTFFDFPSFSIDSNNVSHIILQIGTYRIETILFGFVIHLFLIQGRKGFVCHFTIKSAVFLRNKSLRISSFFLEREEGFSTSFFALSICLSLIAR